MMPKRKTVGYTKPYPNEYELIPLPPKYRLPDFTKFSGSDGSSSIEHVSRYLAQLGMISASDELRVRYFSQSLTGSAFGWYTSLPPNSIQTAEAGIADLAQVRQKRGETVAEYIQRFRTVRNRCYSVHVSEKEAVELAVVGLSSSIKDVASQADYPSLAHMVQKLSAAWTPSEKGGDEDCYSHSKDTEEAAPCDRLRQDGKRYVTEGEVKNIRYQRPLSDHLLNKYVSRYDQRRRHGDDDERDRLAGNDRRHRRRNHDEERQERHAREQDDTGRHWDCPFFRHCWDSGMSRLPTIGNCPECNQKRKEAANVSVFERLGPLPPQSRRAETPRLEDLEDSEDEGEDEEDRYHRPRWCPDGLSHSQKRRVQRLHGLEEAERLYLHTLRKARPDLAAKVQRTLDEEGLPQRKEWHPKQRKADDETSAGTNMVLIRPAKCRAPRLHDAPEVDNSKRTNVIKSEIGLVLSTGLDK
ncbi:hypothetical protein QYE76_068219 [Lolium multiflorum]|uniref:Retrotransposon gag domain-containing protein n=1 Tax=Lolium multiflorum TaxID=4521 RepID=A0AAD8SEC2_LOLMU|nr:hypothetical protein QYE76_068219 [Lolium multiflorum]